MAEDIVEYTMCIKFHETDEVEVEFSGTEIKFNTENKIRPRHIKLIATIQEMMREYVRRK